MGKRKRMLTVIDREMTCRDALCRRVGGGCKGKVAFRNNFIVSSLQGHKCPLKRFYFCQNSLYDYTDFTQKLKWPPFTALQLIWNLKDRCD